MGMIHRQGSKENDSSARTWVNNGWWSLSEMWKEKEIKRQ